MAFTEAEKVNIRRYCGYQVFGRANLSQMGVYYNKRYLFLETILESMSPEEEAVVRDLWLVKLAEAEGYQFDTICNMDTSSAGPWVRNDVQTEETTNQYTFIRVQFVEYLGVEAGPGIPGQSMNMRIIV